MTVYQNPLLMRASEQYRNAHQFVTMFGVGALDMLPEPIWDRLVVLRSTPGAGKTSLMRLFTLESLEWVRQRVSSNEPIYTELRKRDVFDNHGPRKIGVYIDLDRDYKSLLDLPVSTEIGRRLFLRLLDVRIVMATMRASLFARKFTFPEDVARFQLGSTRAGPEIEAAALRLGGTRGDSLLEYARDTERRLLSALDALVKSEIDNEFAGHNELYSLRVLSDAPVVIDGIPLEAQPLVMFDDGHQLYRPQRDALLDQLRSRRSNVARWYAERFEALSDQELLGDVGREGRDYVLIDLDAIARHGTKDSRRFQRGRYEKVLSDIARRRAAPALMNYAEENQEFLELLDEAPDEMERIAEVVSLLRERVHRLAGGDERYARWLGAAEKLVGFQAATRWRELEILIIRDRDRQMDLFDTVLDQDDLVSRSSASLREGAALLVAKEFELPYYGGSKMLIRLGSYNAEQFLNLCGDLFAEMLVDVSLGRPPRLNLARQHRVIRKASERFWQGIPRTVPNGREVQALVSHIVGIAQADNAKPTLPYPPGVTGSALLMGEREQLLDETFRQRTPGAERLFAALASAVAHNILQVELDYSVKNDRYMVIYLNRLLCPRFWLPLGYGSFREKPLKTMVTSVRNLPAAIPQHLDREHSLL